MPVSSLPGPFGIGTLGKPAHAFVDFLAQAGQSFWQILPLGPTGYGDSPYQSFSAFAANPYFIDPELLCQKGFLTQEELAAFDWSGEAERVDYGLLYRQRPHLLQLAADRVSPDFPEFQQFQQEHSFWLEDYALFMALKEEHGQVSWSEWPDPVRLRCPNALDEAKKRLAPRLHFWRVVQFFFYSQWSELKKYANQKGISIIGDLPIYVSPDSADVWTAPELFQLDKDRRPLRVAGCPPDAFSADGQLWGNPLYNWENHKKDGFSWWMRRLDHTFSLCDVVRIDHFRGFESYYSIPAGDTTAENGCWCKGPNLEFIKALHAHRPNARIIAEDLGFLTPEVIELLKASGYPGMKVLQFAFDRRESGDYLPHNYIRNSVVYTGTHDTTTTANWAADAAPQDVEQAREYLNCPEGHDLTDAFVRQALASISDTAIVPLWDWLGLGAQARINTPSRPDGNWQWRAEAGCLTPALAQRMRRLTDLYGRMQK